RDARDRRRDQRQRLARRRRPGRRGRDHGGAARGARPAARGGPAMSSPATGTHPAAGTDRARGTDRATGADRETGSVPAAGSASATAAAAPVGTSTAGAPVRIALIGTRGFGRVHLENLERLREVGRAELIGVVDLHEPPAAAQGIWHRDPASLLAAPADAPAEGAATAAP